MKRFKGDSKGLEATLQLYRDPDRVHESVPILRMLSTTIDQLHRRAESFREELAGRCDRRTARRLRGDRLLSDAWRDRQAGP